MIGKILKFFVGDKSKKDLKLINPIIDKIHSFHPEVSNFSNDELRAETIDFKNKMQPQAFTMKLIKLNQKLRKKQTLIKKNPFFPKLIK